MNKKNDFSNPEIILSSKTKINEINQKFKVLVNESLYEILIKEMESAKKSIDLSVYLFTTTSNPKLERINDILMEKAKNHVIIRILVPSIKTKISRLMQKSLKKLSQSGIHVKFYRELHGKCLIIDEKRVLIFTANIDKYLVDEKSCDIGYAVSNQVAVKNFCIFFEHLWMESADNFDINTPINLHTDLVIKSYELISYKPSISVLRLKNLIENSKNINFLHHSTGSLLQINGKNGKVLNLYIELKDQQSFEIREDRILLFGMINNKPKMNLKDSVSYSVKNLSLNLFWAK